MNKDENTVNMPIEAIATHWLKEILIHDHFPEKELELWVIFRRELIFIIRDLG